jgi:hypothetical protein
MKEGGRGSRQRFCWNCVDWVDVRTVRWGSGLCLDLCNRCGWELWPREAPAAIADPPEEDEVAIGPQPAKRS